MAKMSPVVHFEMPSKDKKRTAEFYSKVFGWQMDQLGADMGDYLLAGTTEVDEKMMPTQPGAINGGFFDYADEPGRNIPHLVISVEDIEQAIKDVEAAGGKIIGGATGPGIIDDIPGVGRYIAFEDSEGNRVGMMQFFPIT